VRAIFHTGLAAVIARGLTPLSGAAPAAGRYVQFFPGDDGQRILARHGFAPPAKP
jgi:hypothetical protein